MTSVPRQRPGAPVRKLVPLLRHCADSVPHYHGRIDRAQLERDPLAVLDALPLADKPSIRADYERFLSARVTRDPRDRRRVLRALGDEENLSNETPLALPSGATLFFEKTSGSTGVPFKLVKTYAERLSAGQSVWRLRRRLDPEVRPVNLFPFEHAPAGFEFPWDLGDYSPDNVGRCLAEIARRGYRWLHGHPQALRWWADVLCERPETPRPDFNFVESNGSLLDRADRGAIERAFGCTVIDNYNCREVWTIAYACGLGRLHANDEQVWLELVDEDGRPVRTPGRPGRLLVTSLTAFALPLVRYRLGDWAAWGGAECACGRPSRIVEICPDPQRRRIASGDGALAAEVFSKVTRFLYGTFDYQYRRIQVVQRGEADFAVYAADFLGEREEFARRFRRVFQDLLPALPARLDFYFVSSADPLWEARAETLFVDERAALQAT